jgi:hypothetical protein
MKELGLRLMFRYKLELFFLIEIQKIRILATKLDEYT